LINEREILRTKRKNKRNVMFRRKKGCIKRKESENTFKNSLILSIRKK
jgi:hypothetical protein